MPAQSELVSRGEGYHVRKKDKEEEGQDIQPNE